MLCSLTSLEKVHLLGCQKGLADLLDLISSKTCWVSRNKQTIHGHVSPLFNSQTQQGQSLRCKSIQFPLIYLVDVFKCVPGLLSSMPDLSVPDSALCSIFLSLFCSVKSPSLYTRLYELWKDGATTLDPLSWSQPSN